TVLRRSATVRATERLVARQLGQAKPRHRRPPSVSVNANAIEHLQSRLQEHLGTRVVLHHGEKQGRIEIEYYGADDLQRIMQLIGSQLENVVGDMRSTLSRALFFASSAILSGQGCSLRSAPLWENFSGEKSFAHVQHLVDLGPRPAGSEALEKSRLYIIEQLKSAGWTVARSEFSDQTPRGKITFVNLIARFGTSEKKEAAQFLLCSHYDTKTFDTIRFVGANDGGSSTGLLIEMARVLALSPALAAKIE